MDKQQSTKYLDRLAAVDYNFQKLDYIMKWLRYHYPEKKKPTVQDINFAKKRI